MSQHVLAAKQLGPVRGRSGDLVNRASCPLKHVWCASGRIGLSRWGCATEVNPSFTFTDGLTILLTSETLVFAALAVVVTFALPSNRIPRLPLSVAWMGVLVVLFVALIAFGALMAWWSTFIDHWPAHFQGRAVAVVLAAAIVGQPLFAFLLACGLRNEE